MPQPSPGTSQPEKPSADRLDSWKEIAAYLGRDVTTVQRWEKRERMPVHRHLHDKMGSVYASKAELDVWVRGRNLQAASPDPAGIETAALPKPVSRPWKLFILMGVLAILGLGAVYTLQRFEYFWTNPIAGASVQAITDFDGVEQAAAISRDGHFVAFLSDRDGQMDVWVTQVGSGQFHNLTHGTSPELVNSSVRTLSFTADGSLVAYWTRKHDKTTGSDISIWAVPTLGGQPKVYLDGVAEFDWTPDGRRLAYHTPGPGDPLYITDGTVQPNHQPIFTAPAGLHSHYPLWSPDAKFIYFVLGTPPDKLDIWRIPSSGGTPERITSQAGRVTYPVLVDRRTLMYLASEPDGSGPSLYSMDVEHRIPHRLTFGPDRYTSLASSADGKRLVLTLASPKRTLWKLASLGKETAAVPVSLTTSSGFSPRLGPNYLLYVTATGTAESIWKLADGTSTELWTAQGAQIIGGPAISRDGGLIAFSAKQKGRTLLYTMRSDGSGAHTVSESLDLQGDPTWSPDGLSIISAVNDHGVPHLFRIPTSGGEPAVFISEYSTHPAWSPDGRFVMYSGPDIGTTLSVKAADANGAPYALPELKLPRGARHVVFLPGGHTLVVLRGELEHKNLWQIDLDTGTERQLTNLGPEFDIRNFDVSPDGKEIVLERVQERSDVVLLDLAKK